MRQGGRARRSETQGVEPKRGKGSLKGSIDSMLLFYINHRPKEP